MTGFCGRGPGCCIGCCCFSWGCWSSSLGGIIVSCGLAPILVAFLAAADLVVVASSHQPVSLPRLAVDPASVVQHCLGVVCLLACAVGDFVGILR